MDRRLEQTNLDAEIQRHRPDSDPPPSTLRRLSVEEFHERLAQASARVLAYQTREVPQPASQEWSLRELDEAWDELKQADEELLSQRDEIVAAHDQLSREQQRYRHLFDFAPEPYLVTDTTGKITMANRAATCLFQAPCERLEGKLLISRVPLPARPAFREALRTVAQQSAVRWTTTLLPFDAPHQAIAVPVDISAAPGGDGRVLWCLRDSTDRVQREGRMRTFQEELERCVVARTHELECSQRVLEEVLVSEREAKRRAEAADASKEEFVAQVAHELRSPLQVLLGWTEILQEQSHAAALPSALRTLHRTAQAMSSLVDDLLDRASLVRGEVALQRQTFCLRDSLGDLCTAFVPLARKRDLDLVFEPEVSELVVVGDRPRLEQVFGNLLTNALKFTPARGRVHVHLRRESDRAVVLVTDSGEGIEEELLPHLFDPYRQGTTPSGRPHSLGLGLAIVRQVISAHGGTVVAHSQGAGRGATFVVTLPLPEESRELVAGS